MLLADVLLASYDPSGKSMCCSRAVSHAALAGAAAAAAVVVAHQPSNARALVIIARVAAARCVQHCFAYHNGNM